MSRGARTGASRRRRLALFGRDTRTFGAQELKRLEHRVVAVVAALPQVHQDLSLLDKSTLTARMSGMRPGPVVETARELFADVGLAEQSGLKPPHVGAQAVRMTALIRAIVPRPSLLVVEPEAIDTDVNFADTCGRLLREYATATAAGVFWSTYSTRPEIPAWSKPAPHVASTSSKSCGVDPTRRAPVRSPPCPARPTVRGWPVMASSSP